MFLNKMECVDGQAGNGEGRRYRSVYHALQRMTLKSLGLCKCILFMLHVFGPLWFFFSRPLSCLHAPILSLSLSLSFIWPLNIIKNVNSDVFFFKSVKIFFVLTLQPPFFFCLYNLLCKFLYSKFPNSI